MSRKHIMILGAGVMQLPALNIARDEGWITVVADGNDAAVGRPQSDFFGHVDLRDLEGLVALAEQHRSRHRLDGVFTAGTDFSTSVAYVAERLGLPGIPYEAALNASNKDRMRDVFARCGVPSPPYFRVDRLTPVESIEERAASIGYPLVVKPVDNMGARGVVRIDHSGDLNGAVTTAIAFSASGSALVEQLIGGREYSIDAVVDAGRILLCGVADRDIRFAPWFVEVGHTMPSAEPTEAIDKLIAVFCAGVRALGIDNGAAKGDLFLDDRGPVIGEIAARLSGGYMSGWTYPLSSGVEPTRAAMRLALGEPPGDLSPTMNRVSVERAVLSIPGVVESVAGFERAESVPDVRELFRRVEAGDSVTFPTNNVEKCGNIITCSVDRETAMSRALQAIRCIDIRLVPGEESTLEYLLGNSEPDSRDFFPILRDPALDITAMDPTAADPGQIAGHVDYGGRSLGDTLNQLRTCNGYRLIRGTAAGRRAKRRFTQAVAKGGLQGGRFFLDTISRVRHLRERLLSE